MLIVAALFIEVLVPAGYMPTITNGAFLMQPCARQGAPVMAMIANASDSVMHADHNTTAGPANESDHNDRSNLATPCIFSSLSPPAVNMTDPILLTIAIAFILAASFHPETRAERRHILYPRPPSQGPPLA